MIPACNSKDYIVQPAYCRELPVRANALMSLKVIFASLTGPVMKLRLVSKIRLRLQHGLLEYCPDW